MAGKPVHTYPDPDEIVRLVRELGSITAVARQLGMARPTLQHHVEGVDGLVDRCHGAAKEYKAAHVKARGGKPGEPVSELEILRQRAAELERAAKHRRDEEVADERIVQRLEEALGHLRPHRFTQAKRRRRRQAPHEMALLFSDTHAYEVVDRAETLGMNEYNRAVLLRRMERLQAGVLSYLDHRPYPVSKLHVWMLGDMLSGDIHDELSQTNEMPHEEATVQFALDCASWLEGFVPHFEHIHVAGVPGNHPRRARKPTAKMAHNNSDWTAYKMVEVYHRGNPAFSWQFPKAAYCVTEVADRWRTLLMHGDGIRTTMPGVPWGGVVRRITTLEQQFAKAKQPIDYVCLGHFHSANALDGVGVKTVLNGSVKGLDEYSLKSFGSGRAPSQTLLTFHRDHGLTDISYLDLEDVSPAAVAA